MAISSHQNYKTLLCLAVLGALFSACATTPKTKKSSVPNTEKSGLPPQTLAVGECGLFVWAATSNKPFILFSKEAQSNGFWYNGAQEPITLIKRSGAKAFKQSPVNTYQRSNGQTLNLVLSNAEMIEDGIRYKSGTLTFQTDEGWEKIMPVIGSAACQTQMK